jgi:acyl-CoA oxidase
MKYWIGAASEFANMSIIWAQLVIDGKSQGPHPFVVPIRCKKTHRVLSGIVIGDCGPKNGLDYIDNGYIILNNVRIPRENLLGKLGSVDEKGNYRTLVDSIDARFGFHMSPLSGGRGAVSFITNAMALKAATAALRYACSRKQFDNPQKNGEVIIIDYALTKNRIIPEIAQLIVQISPGLDLAKRYFEDANLLSNMKYTSELHAISACVKARISWNCTSTTETTRTILGGHGYSAYSNFKSYFHDTDINNTWEGDNNMLLQQTSKYLMKAIAKKQKSTILDISFIWASTPFDEGKVEASLRSIESLDSLLKQLVVLRYKNAATTFEELSKTYANKHEVWLHFHPQAGNSLALSYGTLLAIQLTTSFILSPGKDWDRRRTKTTGSSC